MQAEELCRAKGVELPQDFAEAAMDNGLRTIVLEEYIRLQVGALRHRLDIGQVLLVTSLP